MYVKRMLPAEKEQKRSHVLLEGVTTDSSSTDEALNNGSSSAAEEDQVQSEADRFGAGTVDTLMRIMDLEGVTISESGTDGDTWKRTSSAAGAVANGGQARLSRGQGHVRTGYRGSGDQRDFNYNDEDDVVVDDLEGHSDSGKINRNSGQVSYANWLPDFALPILFRRRGDRKDDVAGGGRLDNRRLRPRSDYVTTASAARGGDAAYPDSAASLTGQLDLSSFEFVENIELHHLDGFIFSSQREKGRGHAFECLQLSSPSWCDKCGDFIWGVYKQCLRCKREYHNLSSPLPPNGSRIWSAEAGPSEAHVLGFLWVHGNSTTKLILQIFRGSQDPLEPVSR